MLIYRTKMVKFFLSGIFILMINISSHADEGVIYYGDAVIVGKEYLVVESASENKDTLKEQNLQTEIASNDNPCIFIAKDAKIHGKEHLYTKPNPSQKITKTAHKTKRKPIEPVKNEVTEKKLPEEIIVPDFPFDSSSLYHSYSSKGSAVPVSPQRLHDYQTICKGNHGNTNSKVENSSLTLYLPEQRQKFSTAATQYGILTSFIPNSPPL